MLIFKLKIQQIWDNVHETRDSISIISYAGCLGLSPVISAKIYSKCAPQHKIAKQFTKTPILGAQGHLKSSILVPMESSSAVLVMIRSKSVSICNHSCARLVDSSRKWAFWRGCLNLMHSYGGLLVHRGSKLALLKSMFNAENFNRRLYLSISSDFDAVQSWNVCGSCKSPKNSLETGSEHNITLCTFFRSTAAGGVGMSMCSVTALVTLELWPGSNSLVSLADCWRGGRARSDLIRLLSTSSSSNFFRLIDRVDNRRLFWHRSTPDSDADVW